MYVCMYVCMYGWMDGWMYGWMDVAEGPDALLMYMYIYDILLFCISLTL